MKTKCIIAIAALYVAVFLMGCTSVRQIGDLNMIATRNIDKSIKYEPLATYSGGSKTEIEKSRATSVDQAVDQTVKKVPGGEYLMNAKVFLVNNQYIAVEGDVYGIANQQQNYRGLKIGDNVTWKTYGTFNTGIITALKDDKTCYIKSNEDTRTYEVKYEIITKIDKAINTEIKDNTSVFNTGETVNFKNTWGNSFQGKIVEIGEKYAVIEYTNSLKNVLKETVKIEKISKATP